MHEDVANNPNSILKSTMGRPRALTDLQVQTIRVWHNQILEWQARRARLKTLRQLARELAVAPATISHVIKCAGQFKQPSPEKRALEAIRRSRRFTDLREQGFL